jgi:glycyl-tRNA synthetase
MQAWLRLIGLRDEFVRIREHDPDELSHYSSRTIDFEYLFPGAMGWRELYGLANRTDFDLRQHQEFSGEDLQYFDQAENRRYLPYVIEPTFGVDRTFLTLLVDAYDEESVVDVNGKPDTRTVLRLHPRVAPYKAAVLPLLKKPDLVAPAQRLFDMLNDETNALVDYDETGNIGKRYRRQDEIGTPFCFTVDFDTLEDDSVTVRNRDDMTQERLPLAAVVPWLEQRIA